MKATGIVRRIDDLGRVVIPKEIRRTLRIREGDPPGNICRSRRGGGYSKKILPIGGELSDFAQEYADSLAETVGHIASICDRDIIIAVAGAPKKEFLNKPISGAVEKVMEERQTVLINNPEENKYCKECLTEDEDCRFSAEVIAPYHCRRGIPLVPW